MCRTIRWHSWGRTLDHKARTQHHEILDQQFLLFKQIQTENRKSGWAVVCEEPDRAPADTALVKESPKAHPGGHWADTAHPGLLHWMLEMQRSCCCCALSTCPANPPGWFPIEFSPEKLAEVRPHAPYTERQAQQSIPALMDWPVVRQSCLGDISEWQNDFINLISHSAKLMALARALWRERKPQNNVWRGHLIDSLHNGISQNPSGSTSHLRGPQILFFF